MPHLHCRAQLAGLVSERDGLREDLHSQREAKRMSDQGWKSERLKVQNLEKELAFYQSQSTRYVWHPHLCLSLYVLPSMKVGAEYIPDASTGLSTGGRAEVLQVLWGLPPEAVSRCRIWCRSWPSTRARAPGVCRSVDLHAARLQGEC